MALSKLSPDHPARRHLDQSLEASRRAANLAREMLAYSGKANLDFTRVSVNEVIRSNIDLFDSAVGRAARIESDLDPDLPPIDGDATQIEQVLMNLILNASEAGATRIQIATPLPRDRTDQRQIPRCGAGRELVGRFVYVEVRDDGSGIETSLQDRLFDPFFTTKFTGRGLGLASVLGIVRGHRGGISVQSKLDEGSVFRVFLPFAQDTEKGSGTSQERPALLGRFQEQRDQGVAPRTLPSTPFWSRNTSEWTSDGWTGPGGLAWGSGHR